MLYYFPLQFKMLNRQIADFGLHPVVGYLLALPAFVALSVLLFLKIEFAVYLYVLLALSLVSGLGEPGRNLFLKTCFSTLGYYRVRTAENIIIVLPFVIFLLFESAFPAAFLLISAAVLMVFFNIKSTGNFTLPTPFYKRPFEFIVGFRNAFPIVFLTYFLAFMAVVVNNFNLGVFSLMFVFVICISFYAQPENEFYVWIFSSSAKGFLFHKIKAALIYSTLLCLPLAVGLGLFYNENLLVIIGFLFLGYLYLVTVILAKYSAYPEKMNVPQALFIAFSVLFPPLLLAVIPFFYLQSVQRLNDILE